MWSSTTSKVTGAAAAGWVTSIAPGRGRANGATGQAATGAAWAGLAAALAGAGGLGLLGSSMHTRVPCPRCDCTCTTAPMRGALAHDTQAYVQGIGRNLLYLKAHAIVLHFKAPARMALHPQFHPRCLGMLAHIDKTTNQTHEASTWYVYFLKLSWQANKN